jgi:hypothetical protein
MVRCAGAIELRTALANAFFLDLPATLAFDYPTVAALSQYIFEQNSERDRSFTPPASPLKIPEDVIDSTV